jgi:hypothetical protein
MAFRLAKRNLTLIIPFLNMGFPQDEYKYLFERGFVEIVPGDNNRENPLIRPTDKFWHTISRKAIDVAIKYPQFDPDKVLVKATMDIITDDNESIPKDLVIKYGCFLYTGLKIGGVYQKAIEIIQGVRQPEIK